MRDLVTIYRKFCQTARLMIGVPDYDVYVAHMREKHPGHPVMSAGEFIRDRQDRRYGGGKNRPQDRCC